MRKFEENALPIDNVTTTNLGIALKMIGITLDDETLDKIIDMVELIEIKGNNINWTDIKKLQNEWLLTGY